jgi:hypothetical protein
VVGMFFQRRAFPSPARHMHRYKDIGGVDIFIVLMA